MTSFSDDLRQQADSIWAAQHAHPFVLGIGDGSLESGKFQFWLRQDFLFLIDYARFFATATMRAPDFESMTTFARLLHEILGREMELHRSYCAEFGLTSAELEHTVKVPTTQAYTDFLLRTATTGYYAELLGALLPCIWGYSEVGTALARRGMPGEDRYRRWINVYADPEFEELVHWCRNLLDKACEGLPRDYLDRVAKAFITSSRYELAFWEMAWTQESWPV